MNAMQKIGFTQDGRHFHHPDSKFIIEFPNGPLSVGEEPVKEIREISFETGTLRVISPTDCVKDRLCAYYFWGDLQALEQAIMVVENNSVDVDEIQRWSQHEGKSLGFEQFKSRLSRIK
jgi:hypothetical protein